MGEEVREYGMFLWAADTITDEDKNNIRGHTQRAAVTVRKSPVLSTA